MAVSPGPDGHQLFPTPEALDRLSGKGTVPPGSGGSSQLVKGTERGSEGFGFHRQCCWRVFICTGRSCNLLLFVLQS